MMKRKEGKIKISVNKPYFSLSLTPFQFQAFGLFGKVLVVQPHYFLFSLFFFSHFFFLSCIIIVLATYYIIGIRVK